MNRLYLTITALAFAISSFAQDWAEFHEPSKWKALDGLRYDVEMQASVSDGKTPLWLNANRHGLSSLEETNGYLRAALTRPLQMDSTRRWGIGYGVDVVGAHNYTSNYFVQQAFVEARWLHAVLSVGSKEYPMELKNNELSSGSQTLGINARPVPQVRLALPDYWIIPGTKGWLRMKGHIAYGMMTDDKWQKDFTSEQKSYSEKALFHSKSGFLKIGNEDRFLPLSLELGLEMASIFGGTAYIKNDDGTVTIAKGQTGLSAFWHAFLPGGSEVVEQGTAYQNAEGDQLGSWMARINYETNAITWHFYVEKFFEDHSSMLMMDYDGYGTGDNWDVSESHRYFVYDLKDWLMGMELNFHNSYWINNLVLEYMYTKYQSGPIYHDHSPGNQIHISGRDDFYNHYIYSGWQHWGQVIGNPLFRSPIYNDDGILEVKDNRFMAFHMGFSGEPIENLTYRLRATYQEGLGTYSKPYTKLHHNVSFAIETMYKFPQGWRVGLGYGMDFGHILGHNYGAQLTVSKTGLLTKKHNR